MQSLGLIKRSFGTMRSKIALGALLSAAAAVYALIFCLSRGLLLPNNLSKELKIDFINVGHGDAIFIKTPMGKAFLIDGGKTPSKKAKKLGAVTDAYGFLKKRNIHKLDGVVVSCWHSEHLNGLIPVLEGIKTGYVIEPPGDGKGADYAKFTKICEDKKIARYKIFGGDVLEWGQELFCQCLSPEEAHGKINYSDANNNSLVLLIRYGRVQLILASEAEKSALRQITAYGQGLKSQIIKAPGHGSKTTDFEPFIRLVKPCAAVFCVGKNNPFNCPSEQILLRYEALGTKIFRTDINGTISLCIGGRTDADYRLTSDLN